MSRVVREVVVILVGALLYFWVRGLMETRTGLAFANADKLIALEQRLGLFREPWLQSHIIVSDWMVRVANGIYIFGHWPVIIGTMSWLLWRHSERFALYRSALLISGAIGLLCFVLVPTAPPRFLPEWGFLDTVSHRSEAYRALQPPAFTNQYAAMPSLHVGWNLLMGIAIVRHARSVVGRSFGLLMPPVMFLSTIATANHYLLDGVVGAMVGLIGLAIAWGMSRSDGPDNDRGARVARQVRSAIESAAHPGPLLGGGHDASLRNTRRPAGTPEAVRSLPAVAPVRMR